MGDHRASIRVEFTIHDKTYSNEWWINWFDDGTGVDHRITDWFRECWYNALARYTAQTEELYANERAADIERAERADLARLKTKYEETVNA
mgnify:FL=1